MHFGWATALHNSPKRPPEREERTKFATEEGKQAKFWRSSGGAVQRKPVGPGNMKKLEKIRKHTFWTNIFLEKKLKKRREGFWKREGWREGDGEGVFLG